MEAGGGVDGRANWGGGVRLQWYLANGAGMVGLFELAIDGKLVPLGALATFSLLADTPHHRQPTAAGRHRGSWRLRVRGTG
jgi:hypothetical protein